MVKQPTDGRSAAAHRQALHLADRDQGQLHGSAGNDVRDKISQEFSSQAGQYDVATLSNFEIPIYARSKWIAPLTGYLAKDPPSTRGTSSSR